LVIDYSAARVATVEKAWDTVPDVTSAYELTKAFYRFVAAGSTWAADNIAVDPVSDVIAVQQVIDLSDGNRLIRADRVEAFADVGCGVGNAPSVFADRQGGILFDTPVPEGRSYRIRYFGMPRAFTSESDVPQMPEVFHEALLLWVVWWGLRSLQEFSGAYSTKRDLEDTMASAVQQFDRGGERDNISLYMEDRYESIT
jgi:hypothetical protein